MNRSELGKELREVEQAYEYYEKRIAYIRTINVPKGTMDYLIDQRNFWKNRREGIIQILSA